MAFLIIFRSSHNASVAKLNACDQSTNGHQMNASDNSILSRSSRIQTRSQLKINGSANHNHSSSLFSNLMDSQQAPDIVVTSEDEISASIMLNTSESISNQLQSNKRQYATTRADESGSAKSDLSQAEGLVERKSQRSIRLGTQKHFSPKRVILTRSRSRSQSRNLSLNSSGSQSDHSMENGQNVDANDVPERSSAERKNKSKSINTDSSGMAGLMVQEDQRTSRSIRRRQRGSSPKRSIQTRSRTRSQSRNLSANSSANLSDNG